jgi:hypothetical protein
LAPAVRLSAVDHMPKLLEPKHDVLRDGGLKLVDAVVVKAAREIERLLDVHAVVQHVGQEVDVARWLKLAAHDPERHGRVTITRYETGKKGVERPLTRRDAIRMTRFDSEI